MSTGTFVLGYHGCDREIGEALIAGAKSFKLSNNDHDWLGEGIYFWENNPHRALEWATFMSKHILFRGRVKAPYAVGAVIEPGNCLDLTEAESLRIVRESFDHLAEAFAKTGTELPRNERGYSKDEDLIKRNLDCAVINNVHSLRKENGLEPFSTVRAPFFEGEALYPGGCIQSKTHIQICVQDPSRIRGIFHIPRNS